jgi:hypothetical protein
MDLKKKFAETKNKIKEHRTEIIAVVSTGAAIAASVAYVLTDKKLKLAWEGNKRLLEAPQYVTKETLWISDETEQEILDGSKDVWFDVRGKRFDVILHPED